MLASGKLSDPARESQRGCRVLRAPGGAASPEAGADDRVRQTDDEITIVLPDLEAAVRKRGYVTGVAAQSFLDKRTGFRDPVLDSTSSTGSWSLGVTSLIATGSTRNWCTTSTTRFTAKPPSGRSKGHRSALRPGSSIPTSSRKRLRRRDSGVSVSHGRTGPQGRLAVGPGDRLSAREEVFVSSDRITSVNDSAAMFLRIDMPGHMKQTGETRSARST